MSPFDRKQPPTGVEAPPSRARELTTAGGIKVIVGGAPYLAPPEPPPEAPLPMMVFPPDQPEEERQAFVDALCRQYGGYVAKLLEARVGRREILAESAKDIGQRVLMIFCAHVEQQKPIGNARAFLAGVVENEVCNHRRLAMQAARAGVDADVLMDAGPDPEEEAALAEEREKLARYLECLPEDERGLVRRAYLEGTPIQDLVDELGRPRTNVVRELAGARDKLRELARASERAKQLRARRRAGR